MGLNQCAICRQERHWMNECPDRKEKDQSGDDNVMMLEDLENEQLRKVLPVPGLHLLGSWQSSCQLLSK